MGRAKPGQEYARPAIFAAGRAKSSKKKIPARPPGPYIFFEKVGRLFITENIKIFHQIMLANPVQNRRIQDKIVLEC